MVGSVSYCQRTLSLCYRTLSVLIPRMEDTRSLSPVRTLAETAGEYGGSESGPQSTSGSAIERVTKKGKRQIDFSRYNKRHVALKVAYLGSNYHGFANQPNVETVEGQLFAALLKTKVIEDSQSCGYSCCGRTDIGVSGFGQVVSLYLRTRLSEGVGVVISEGSTAQERKDNSTREDNYMTALNSVLPEDIRIIGWAPVKQSFSARFSCLQRVYKYYFPCGDMDVEAMAEAAQKFVGEHDFRNFCKMDISGGVTQFTRRILSVDINPVDNSPPSPNKMFELTVSGNAFLWHQIRCMIAVLFLIGSRLENSEVIDHMLNIEECPKKPEYGMAPGHPLVFYKSVYEDVCWQNDPISFHRVVNHFQNMWTFQMCRTSMLFGIVNALATDDSSFVPSGYVSSLTRNDHRHRGPYLSLLSRPTAPSLEERLQNQKIKRTKLNNEELLEV